MADKLRSRWCVFVVRHPINTKPTERMVAAWHKIHVEKMTYYTSGPVIRAVAKASQAAPETLWMHLVKSLSGHDPSLEKMNKHTDIPKLLALTPKQEADFTQNWFTLEQAMTWPEPVFRPPEPEVPVRQDPPHVHIFACDDPTKLEGLAMTVPKMSVPGTLLQDLQALPWLEVRRMLGRLERIVHRKGNFPPDIMKNLMAERGKWMNPTYIFADPLTLYVPLLASCVENEPMPRVLKERARYTAETIRPLWEYGRKLSGLVSNMTLQSSPRLFRDRLDGVVPETLLKYLDKEPDAFNPPDISLIRNTRRKFEGYPTPLLDLHDRMRNAMQYAFCKAPSQDIPYSNLLPPTPSEPDAVYRPMEFMQKIEELMASVPPPPHPKPLKAFQVAQGAMFTKKKKQRVSREKENMAPDP